MGRIFKVGKDGDINLKEAEDFEAKEVFDLVKASGEGLYYVASKNWSFPIAVFDEDVVGLVTDKPEAETLKMIQEMLDYQQS